MTMPSTIGFEFGQIVLVCFPFTDLSSTKQRPAVVISNVEYNQKRPDLILIAVTSQIRTSASFGEMIITNWQSAGLLKPSAVKPIIFTANKSIIKKPIGRLSSNDQQILKTAINIIIG